MNHVTGFPMTSSRWASASRRQLVPCCRCRLPPTQTSAISRWPATAFRPSRTSPKRSSCRWRGAAVQTERWACSWPCDGHWIAKRTTATRWGFTRRMVTLAVRQTAARSMCLSASGMWTTTDRCLREKDDTRSPYRRTYHRTRPSSE